MAKEAALARRNLGLGYSLPIIGGVIALLTGLIISDLTHTSLDIWIWVLIYLILGAGLILGTRFATASFNYSEAEGKKVGAVRGARNMNLVLGIIWSAVVIIVSFEKGSTAVNRLLVWHTGKPTAVDGIPKGKTIYYSNSLPHIMPLTYGKFLADFVPAFVIILIAVVGVYLLLAERAREK